MYYQFSISHPMVGYQKTNTLWQSVVQTILDDRDTPRSTENETIKILTKFCHQQLCYPFDAIYAHHLSNLTAAYDQKYADGTVFANSGWFVLIFNVIIPIIKVTWKSGRQLCCNFGNIAKLKRMCLHSVYTLLMCRDRHGSVCKRAVWFDFIFIFFWRFGSVGTKKPDFVMHNT